MRKLKSFAVVAVAAIALTVTFGFIKVYSDKRPAHQQKKPLNVVLIIVDQYRADASRREGFKLNTTPFLDSLAETGTWFNKAYCAAPICAPSRISMFTGASRVLRAPGQT